MNDTIVYHEAGYDFDIVASPLQPVITDGTQRIVSPHETLVLDASSSYDPDVNTSTPVTDFT